jgi:hypothetical protein
MPNSTKEPRDSSFQLELPPGTKATVPSITLTISASSPTLSRSNPKDPFVIGLTTKLDYHSPISIHTFDNIFRTVPEHGKRIDEFLDFISLTPLRDDLLSSDDLSKEAKDPEAKAAVEEKEPIKLFWSHYEDFIDLEPKTPSTFTLKLGPWPISKPHSSPRQKDKDGRWIWDRPQPQQEEWDWGVIGDLEEGVEYELRLKRKIFVKWWRRGERDDFLEIYKRENWVWAFLLGGKWKGEGILEEDAWIEVKIEGDMPRFLVVE